MARLVWCRRCGADYLSVAGQLAETCPTCGQEARWTTTMPLVVSGSEPRVPWTLTYNDVRMLKRLRIAVDDAS